MINICIIVYFDVETKKVFATISLSCINSMLDSHIIAPLRTELFRLINYLCQLHFFGSANSKELFRCFLSDSILM